MLLNILNRHLLSIISSREEGDGFICVIEISDDRNLHSFYTSW